MMRKTCRNNNEKNTKYIACKVKPVNPGSLEKNYF